MIGGRAHPELMLQGAGTNEKQSKSHCLLYMFKMLEIWWCHIEHEEVFVNKCISE